MGLNCGAKMIKYILFVFNLVCAIGGIALMVIGGIALKKIGDAKHVFDNSEHPGYIAACVIALGALVFVIAFFGCCGAMYESICLMNLYTLCLLAMVVLQIVLAAFVLIYNSDVLQYTQNGWSKLWQGKDVSEINREAINGLQSTFECCGSNSLLDYGPNLPESCCPKGNEICSRLQAYKTGCAPRFRELVQNSSTQIAYLSIAMAVVELLGVVFGCCLSSSFRNTRSFNTY